MIGPIEERLIDFIVNNLVEEGILIALACFGIGWIIKHCLPRINNNWIVPINAVCGIILALCMPIPGDTNLVKIAVKGMVLGLIPTGGYELFKCTIKLGGKDLLKKVLVRILKSD